MTQNEISTVGATFVLPSSTPSGLQFASDSVRRFQAASMAENTVTAYESDWRMFVQWCAQREIPPLPAAPMIVAHFVAEMAELTKEDGSWRYAPATMSRWIAAINKAHTLAGHVGPGTDPEVQTTLRGIRRAHAKPPKRAAALLIGDLRKTLLDIDLTSFPAGVIGHRDMALLLFGFAGAFRRSELVGALTIGDITRNPEDGLHVRVTRSKTDQEGLGQVKALPYGSNPVTCAPCAYVRWIRVIAASQVSRPVLMRTLRETEPSIHVCREALDLSSIDKATPLFRAVRKGGIVSVSGIGGHSVNNILKKRVGNIGLNDLSYSGHSLRAGFITQSFRAGASAHEIMRQTGHKNPATLEIYSRENDPLRQNSVTRLGL